MKQLKSSIGDLKEIFEKSINASCITEPFCSFDETANAVEVKNFMDKENFDVIGIRKDGVIDGYAYREDLEEGQLGKYLNKFKDNEVLPNTIAIKEVLKAIKDNDRAFITSFDKIAGIVTPGDMQKIPIRMWLFSLVSLIEMQMLRIINKECQDDSWKELISGKRLESAKKQHEELKEKNKEINLLNCLQFCDKRDIICKCKTVLDNLKTNKRDFERLLKSLENLRNNLAHAQDIIMDDWLKVITLSNQAEELLKKLEQI